MIYLLLKNELFAPYNFRYRNEDIKVINARNREQAWKQFLLSESDTTDMQSCYLLDNCCSSESCYEENIDCDHDVNCNCFLYTCVNKNNYCKNDYNNLRNNCNCSSLKSKYEYNINYDVKYGSYYFITPVIYVKIYENHLKIGIVSEAQMKEISFQNDHMTMPDRKKVIKEFEDFCCLHDIGKLIKSNEELNYYIWSYKQFDEYYNLLCKIMISSGYYPTMAWRGEIPYCYTIIEHKINYNNDLYIVFHIDIFDKKNIFVDCLCKILDSKAMEIFFNDKDMKNFLVSSINTNFTSKFEENNNYKKLNIDIIKEPLFLTHFNAALVIQNAWKDARVNPYCKLGINTINRNYDEYINNKKIVEIEIN